jgi:antitoxin HicB
MSQEFTATVLLEPAEEGGFLVLVPALPEVVTYGETEQEALAMAEDAIRLAIEYRREQGETIPPPTTPALRQIKVALPA